MGRGQISFWYDKWLEDGALCKMVLFVNIHDIYMSVSDVLDAGSLSFSKLATILPVEMCAKIISSPIVPHSKFDDVMCWAESSSGIYTANSGYSWLVQ